MKYACLLLGMALAAAVVPALQWENVARDWGLTRVFPNGGADTKKFIIETTGSGVGLFDYDNDGYDDALVLSGEGGSNRLYRNVQGKRFEDVTGHVGLVSKGWAQGVCAGDYDNDGFTDVFVTFWGGGHLYHNDGGKKFTDVTVRAGLVRDDQPYSTGCAFLDANRDGRLDLFVANYLHFDPRSTPLPGANPYCFYRGMAVNCGPRGLPFERNLLYRNRGDGTFEDVSIPSGVAEPQGHYSLGVLTGDFDGDGWPDVYVAADQTPSLLYVNRRDGTFSEEGLLRGVALDADGKALSGMGATAADFEDNGLLDIFRTNFSDERETLYRNRGNGEFDDVTFGAGLAKNTQFVGWGCSFLDFDLDGWKDLLLVNGHVFPEVDQLKANVKYRDHAILYRNRSNGTFDDVSTTAGPALKELHSSRGLAVADLDHDGRLEALINNQNEAPSLWKLRGSTKNHWIEIRLQGTHSNRSALGSKVTVLANGHLQTDEVRSGGGYLSQNSFTLHFGVGVATKVDLVKIRWISGEIEEYRDVPIDTIVTWREGDQKSLPPSKPTGPRRK